MKRNLYFILFLWLMTVPVWAHGQLYAVSGTVTDSITSKPLTSVNVYDNISKTGTITNEKGYYRLLLKSGTISLSFSYEKHTKNTYKTELKKDIQYNLQIQTKKASVQNQSDKNEEMQKDSTNKNVAHNNEKRKKFWLF